MTHIFKICFEGQFSGDIFAKKVHLDKCDQFADFMHEIFYRKPILKDQLINIYYIDADGDRVIIFNESDFNIFIEHRIKKVFIEKKSPIETIQFQEKTTPTTTSAPNLVRHASISCDICFEGIRGYRYKCLECHNFDLCMKCEPTSHGHHLMIRIADPTKTVKGKKIIENWRQISNA